MSNSHYGSDSAEARFHGIDCDSIRTTPTDDYWNDLDDPIIERTWRIRNDGFPLPFNLLVKTRETDEGLLHDILTVEMYSDIECTLPNLRGRWDFGQMDDVDQHSLVVELERVRNAYKDAKRFSKIVAEFSGRKS